VTGEKNPSRKKISTKEDLTENDIRARSSCKTFIVIFASQLTKKKPKNLFSERKLLLLSLKQK
jgi:hypothetical protein